jgi:hypothetical protein
MTFDDDPDDAFDAEDPPVAQIGVLQRLIVELEGERDWRTANRIEWGLGIIADLRRQGNDLADLDVRYRAVRAEL